MEKRANVELTGIFSNIALDRSIYRRGKWLAFAKFASVAMNKELTIKRPSRTLFLCDIWNLIYSPRHVLFVN